MAWIPTLRWRTRGLPGVSMREIRFRASTRFLTSAIRRTISVTCQQFRNQRGFLRLSARVEPAHHDKHLCRAGVARPVRTARLPPSSTSVAGNASAIDQFRFGSASLDLQPPSQWRRRISGRSRGRQHLRRFCKRIREKAERQSDGMATCALLDWPTKARPNSPIKPSTTASLEGRMATLRLSRYLTAFASYTGTDQSTPSSSPGNTLSGLWQVVSFGIGYSPRETRVNSQ